MGYIDAHVHVWTDDLATYPLADGHSVDDMVPPRFTDAELMVHTQPSGVERVVLIQMSFYESDNSYMMHTIAERPEVFRGVAIVDHRRDDLADEMQRLFTAGVRGFRVYQLAGMKGAPLDAPEYAPLCELAGEMGMAVCPLLDPSFIPTVGRAALRFPKTTFVLDHLARLGAGGVIDGAALDALSALAELPNCMVKVSAFYALGAARPPHDDLIPLIRSAYTAFGADRMMWASDCPYQVQTETYEDSISLVRDRLSFLSEEERAAVLCGTAERVFFG